MTRKVLARLGMTGSVLAVTVLATLSFSLLYLVLGSLFGGLTTIGMGWHLLVPMVVTPPVAYASFRGSARHDRMEQELIRISAQLESGIQAGTAGLARADEESQAEIAERRQVENALRESEQRYRAVMEQVREGIVLYDVSTLQVLVANPAYCALLGYSPEEMSALTLYDIVGHDRDSIDANVRAIRREGRHLIIERQHRRKDGSLIDVEVGANLISYGDTEVLCVLVRDSTERKRAEEVLRRQSERLGALREIDRAILEAQSPWAIAQVALKHLEQQVEHRRASVVAFDFESGTGTVLATHGYGGSRLDSGVSVPLESFNLQELSVGRIRTVEDVQALDRQTATDRILYEEGIHAYINIPLLAQEQLIGSLNLGWAESEFPQRADLEVAEELAGSLAVALQQARLHEQLQHHALELENRAQELARSNAFVTALSEVAIRLQTVSDPEQVMETLGTELESLGMTSMICLLEPDGKALVIRYCSMDSTIMKAGEKLLGARMVGYRMPREKFRIWPEVIEERRAVLMPDVLSLMSPLLPGVLKSTIRHVLRLGGLKPDVQVIWLPLVVGRRTIGGMAVWGIGLLETDALPLTIFAGQVAIALENAHLYAAERQRAQELAYASERLQKELGERRRAEATLKRYATELERSNQELQQFAYVASHDLQEPLRMVTSYLQLLERRYKGQLDADADDFIYFAVDGASRMHELIGGLLTYSRVGTQGAPFELTDCQAVVQRVLANLEVSIRESGALVTCEPLPQVLADATQLEQLFQNLIANALRFRGNRRPEIHVGVEERDTSWLFSVRDNGIGIESQYAERIFSLFQRLHTRDEYPGTGIGLAICKRIVERHGGRIWVESEPGQGATFYYTIPQRR